MLMLPLLPSFPAPLLNKALWLQSLEAPLSLLPSLLCLRTEPGTRPC